jgi:hypothetical protein
MESTTKTKQLLAKLNAKGPSLYIWIAAGIVTLLLISLASFYWLSPKTSTKLARGTGNLGQPSSAIFVSKQAPVMVSLLANPQRLNGSIEANFGVSVVKSVFKNTGIDYQKDIEPWLGNEISLAVTTLDIDRDLNNGRQPGYLIALATAKPEKGKEFLEVLFSKRVLAGATLATEDYQGIKLIYDDAKPQLKSLYGAMIGDNILLFANDLKVLKESVNNVQAPDLNLTSSRKYQQAIKELPEKGLGLAFLNLKNVAEWQGLNIPEILYENEIISLGFNAKGLLAQSTWLSIPSDILNSTDKPQKITLENTLEKPLGNISVNTEKQIQENISVLNTPEKTPEKTPENSYINTEKQIQENIPVLNTPEKTPEKTPENSYINTEKQIQENIPVLNTPKITPEKTPENSYTNTEKQSPENIPVLNTPKITPEKTPENSYTNTEKQSPENIPVLNTSKITPENSPENIPVLNTSKITPENSPENSTANTEKQSQDNTQLANNNLISLSKPPEALRYIPDSVGLAVAGVDLSNLSNSALAQLWKQITPVFSKSLAQPLADLEKNQSLNLPRDIFSWVKGEYAIGLIPNQSASSPNWLFVVENSESLPKGIAHLDEIATKRGLTINQVNILEQKLTVWTKLTADKKIEEGKSGESITLNTNVKGVHTSFGNYEIFANSIDTISLALQKSGNSLIESPKFKDSVNAIPPISEGYVYIDWTRGQKLLESQLPILKFVEVLAKPLFHNLRSLTLSTDSSKSGLIKSNIFFQWDDV